jgi:electron transport complex protein RnfB
MPELDPAAIDALLPQTQCTQCGYAGCLPYAAAIASGEARINQCPPGGDAGIRALAALTGLPYAPLDPAHGVEKPRLLAVIDESACIGCTICIQKCPVDAIAGAAKLMHTVIAAECTGCELCVAPCPVDCIGLVPAPMTHPALAAPLAAASLARRRHRARLERLATARHRARGSGRVESGACGAAIAAEVGAPSARSNPGDVETPAVGSPEHKQLAIRLAQARARARRGSSDSSGSGSTGSTR